MIFVFPYITETLLIGQWLDNLIIQSAFGTKEGWWSLQKLLFSLGYKRCLRRGCFSHLEASLGESNNLRSHCLYSKFLSGTFFSFFGTNRDKRHEMNVLFGKCRISDPNKYAQILLCSIDLVSLMQCQKEMNDCEMIQVRRCFLSMLLLFFLCQLTWCLCGDFFFLYFLIF